MAKLTKQVKDFMWKKIITRIEEELAPLAAEVKEEETRIKQVLVAAELEAVAAFQNTLTEEIPDVWKYVCEHSTYAPTVSNSGAYKLYDTEKKNNYSKKRRDMMDAAEEKFNELVMDVELGGMKKDEVMAMISKMDLG